MNIDFSKRKHESPFADDPPQSEPTADNLLKPPPISQPKTSGTQNGSESAQFRVFMGCGFLAFGVPVSVWAFWCLTGREYGGYPDRQWLEGLLCAAAGLIFFGIAGFLFVRASQMSKKAKTDKLNYEPIDRQMIPVLKNRIKVRATVFQDVLLGFLILFFGGTSLLFLLNAVKQPRNLIIALLNLSILFVICRLIYKAKKNAVRYFEPSGIGRGDLRHVPWQDFRGVIVRTGISRFGQKYVWRIELVFADGVKAWIIPQRIKNFDEVNAFVNKLPQAVLKSD